MRFLSKLKNEGKIKQVEASDEIKQAYLAKSKSSMGAAEILIGTGHLEEATSMIYYSMYYSTLALLFATGIKCENHTGCILLLKDLFRKNDLSQNLNSAKEERVDKQYYTDYQVTKEEVDQFLASAQDFIMEIRQIIKDLSTEKKHELIALFNRL